jgi:hypothetical protein
MEWNPWLIGWEHLLGGIRRGLDVSRKDWLVLDI